MGSNLVVRSSSAEFLIFERQSHSEGIQVRFEEGDLWLTQKRYWRIVWYNRNNITMHLQDIYSNYELDAFATSKDFLLVQKEGNREVKRKVKYYNLDAIILVGYRVNSDRAIQFRRWATNVLKEFSKKGYIIDKKRMENRTFFDEDYESYENIFLSKGENIKLVISRNNLKNPIYVGDTKGDMEASYYAGIPFVYASYGFGKVESFDYKINDISELLDL